jgi:hypothetical protein
MTVSISRPPVTVPVQRIPIVFGFPVQFFAEPFHGSTTNRASVGSCQNHSDSNTETHPNVEQD